MTTTTLRHIAGFAFAIGMTLAMLGTVDRLAYEQHAVVHMAKQAASAPATTAAHSTGVPRT